MNIGTLPFKNIDLKIHDMILFLVHRSKRRRLLGVAFGQPRPPRSTISIHLAKSSIESRIHFGSVPALCIRI